MQSIVLDEALGDLPRLDFVKMDIEGHEPQALEGFSRLIDRHRPVLLVEFNPRCLVDLQQQSPLAFLKQIFAFYPRVRVTSAFEDDETFDSAEGVMAYWERRNREITARQAPARPDAALRSGDAEVGQPLRGRRACERWNRGVKPSQVSHFRPTPLGRPAKLAANEIGGAIDGRIARITERTKRRAPDHRVGERADHFVAGGKYKLRSDHRRLVAETRLQPGPASGKRQNVRISRPVRGHEVRNRFAREIGAAIPAGIRERTSQIMNARQDRCRGAAGDRRALKLRQQPIRHLLRHAACGRCTWRRRR